MKRLRPWRRCFWRRWVGPHDLPPIAFVGQVNRCGRCHALFVVRHSDGGVREWVEDYSSSQRTAYYTESIYVPPCDYWERTTKGQIQRENADGSWDRAASLGEQ